MRKQALNCRGEEMAHLTAEGEEEWLTRQRRVRKKGSNPEHSGNKLEWEFCSSLLVAKLRSWVSESASGFFEESCTHGHTAWQAFPFSFMGVAPFPNQMFGCELYSARSPTSVWPCHLTSLPVWLGMLSDNLSIVTAWPLLLPAGPLV
uniref:Uncharacterized protein n=1 Tax=Picea glauca TaxID=3330 RepID=A0A117NIK2_PICGL|nr:hypothetical protein ABT39_MTgene3291 [Picea glauca]QHR89195.1 hypothetical protein Q903MT_gene3215 [Picea sitchensis]